MIFRHVLVLLALLLGCARVQAQSISLSLPSQFDTVLVNTTDSVAFWVRNAGTTPFTVTDINTTRPEFYVKDTAFTVPANDSIRVFVYFKTNQNVTWKDVLVVTGTGLQGALPLQLRGTARFADASYNSTQGLWENALKTALTNLITNHTSLGYNAARDRMFETIDDINLSDTVECVYTGRRIRAATRTEAQNQNFDTEHTWPQGTFNQSEPMRSDLNHIYPTYSPANNARGSYPFGPVVSNVTWQEGGSKRGNNPNGVVAFEPRDRHKGDVSRAVLYFMLRYQNNYEGYLDQAQEGYLRQWHVTDTVSAKETQRNNRVATAQGKRNPLIDHPGFINRISSFRSSAAPTLYPDISTSAATVSFGTIASGDSVEWTLYILNNGRASLAIGGLALQTPSPVFRILNTPSTVPVDSFAQVGIRFLPTQSNQTYTNALVIQSNDPDEGTVVVPLTGSTTSFTAQTLLHLPANAATDVQIPVAFTWYQTQGANKYHLQLSPTGAFTSMSVNDSTLADSSFSVAGLPPNTIYYWRVRAGSQAGWAAYSETRSFTTWNVPLQVQLQTPPDHIRGVSSPVQFVWQSSPGATSYRLQVSPYQDFHMLAVVDSTLSDTVSVVAGLDTLTTYFWRVQAGNSAGWGEFSPAWQFRIAVGLMVTAQIHAGWNLVSVPVVPPDLLSSSVFPSAVSGAFTYSNGYVQQDSLVPGSAYWVNFGPSQPVSVFGEPIFADTLEVSAGWNLVGAFSFPVSSSSITSIPPGIIISPFYEFNDGYLPAATLMPLGGYWVRTSQQGSLILHRTE